MLCCYFAGLGYAGLCSLRVDYTTPPSPHRTVVRPKPHNPLSAVRMRVKLFPSCASGCFAGWLGYGFGVGVQFVVGFPIETFVRTLQRRRRVRVTDASARVYRVYFAVIQPAPAPSLRCRAAAAAEPASADRPRTGRAEPDHPSTYLCWRCVCVCFRCVRNRTVNVR